MRCYQCCRELPEDEPVYRIGLGNSHPPLPGVPRTQNGWPAERTLASLCRTCLDQRRLPFAYRDEDWHPPHPCQHCGRPVIITIDHKLRKHVICGWDCCKAVQAKVARQRYQESKPAPHPVTCVWCGLRFTAQRNDARYCSQVCKQQAYHQRQREQQAGTALPHRKATLARRALAATRNDLAAGIASHRLNFLAARLNVTENRPRKPGNLGNIGSIWHSVIRASVDEVFVR